MNALVRDALAVTFFGLALWALSPVTEELRAGAYEWTIKWFGLSHAATVVALYVARRQRWVRVAYPAAAILLAGAALMFTYKGGWNDLDDSGTGLVVLALGWPPALWALGTGDLDQHRAEMVRDTVRERSKLGRIIAAAGLMTGLFAWIAADLDFIVAASTAVAFTLSVTSLWLGATLWTARGEVT
ncbi:MAG: hypothetical protein AAF721_23885 [Myxococcota bacterium]